MYACVCPISDTFIRANFGRHCCQANVQIKCQETAKNRYFPATSGGVEQSEGVGVRRLEVLSSSLNKNFNGIAQNRLSSCWCMEKTHLQIK